MREIGLLRKAVLRQGHAQELFQARVEEAVGRLAGASERDRPQPTMPPAPSSPSSAQLRALLELDQAVLQLLRLSEAAEAEPLNGMPGEMPPDETGEDAPQSLREGLSLLQIRVRNLQRSLGLEVIPAEGHIFDDRFHEACGVVRLPGLPDRFVVEEILPGYRLGERVVRPARVVVNLAPEEIS